MPQGPRRPTECRIEFRTDGAITSCVDAVVRIVPRPPQKTASIFPRGLALLPLFRRSIAAAAIATLPLVGSTNGFSSGHTRVSA